MVQKTPTPKPDPKKTEPRKLELTLNLNKMAGRSMVYLILGLLFLPALISWYNGAKSEQITLSQVVRDVRDQKVTQIQIAGSELRLSYPDGVKKTAKKEDSQELLSVFDTAGIDLAAVDVEVEQLGFLRLALEFGLVNVLPIVIMVGAFLFIMRQTRGGPGDLMGFGRSKAKLFVKGKQNVSFKDVGGMDEAKQELEEIVDFLKHPRKYTKVGARTPKGVLLVGPAGTGKTLLARAVAGEANVQFLSIAGSEFMEMLVGVGASRVRDLFTTAKKLAPSIIFIDEVDAIGRMRGHGSMGGHDEREQTLNQILVEMDGFSQNDNVIVMAATNRGDLLDPALVRPGRFDRRVQLNLPDLEERKYILSIHAKGKSFTPDVEWERVARRTVGFSGADLENMLNEAAIAVARGNRTQVTAADIEEASLKVKLGPTKKRLHDEYERRMTAYHEAGHAIVAHLRPHADPVHRISIVSRGRALGYTLTPPEKDKVQTTQSELLDEIMVMMGGRAAEELVFNELTAGASSDISRATNLARAMVTEFGMSQLGPMNYSPQFEMGSYSRAYGEPAKISDRIQEQVDTQINKILTEQYRETLKMLKKYRKELDVVSMALLERETLDTADFEKLMQLEKVKPDYATAAKS